MTFTDALALSREAFWMALVASSPILVIGLVVGLLISLFQAVTQLQEQTLSFAPKVAAMVVAAAVFIPWIAEQMIEYTRKLIESIGV